MVCQQYISLLRLVRSAHPSSPNLARDPCGSHLTCNLCTASCYWLHLRAHLSLLPWAADWRMNPMIMVNADDACYPIIPSYVVGFYWLCSKELCGHLRWPNFPFGKRNAVSVKTGPPTNYLLLYILLPESTHFMCVNNRSSSLTFFSNATATASVHSNYSKNIMISLTCMKQWCETISLNKCIFLSYVNIFDIKLLFCPSYVNIVYQSENKIGK